VRSLLALLVAVNPLAVAVALWPRERRTTMAVAAAIAAAVAVAGAASSGPILEALDVTPGTFRVAAAIVLGLASARWLIVGAPTVAGDGPAGGWGRVGVPLLIPALVTPQLAMVSVSAGADDGVALVAAGAAASLAVAWVATIVAKRHHAGWVAGVRLVAAVAMAAALALAVDGVQTV
jgi:small neutral amino acid transporter SnatA (MarC family)